MTGRLNTRGRSVGRRDPESGRVRFNLPVLLTLEDGTQAPVDFQFAGQIPILDGVPDDFSFGLIQDAPVGPSGIPPIIVIRRHDVIPLPVEDCPPIPGGIDKFPSTAGFSLELASNPGIRYNVRASSAGLPDAVVERKQQVGNTIETEIVSLSLQGNVPGLGRISIVESPTLV